MLADASVEKVLHSADYDVRSLDRDWGFRIRNLFDTSIAAAFTGSTMLGLAAVVQDYLGVELDKNKKLQRADWTERPLSRERQRYASGDVLHLERLRGMLATRLGELDRLAWVAEECLRLSAVVYQPRDPEWAFLSIKGSRALDGRGLAVLRSLHRFREGEAVRRDRPPFKVIPNSALVSLAESPESDLAGVKGLGRFGHRPAADGLNAAIRDGLRDRPVSRPRSPRSGPRLSAEEREKAREYLRRLKEWRGNHGKRLGLDSALLWPAASLERLSVRPGSIEDETASPEVRAWQRRELAESLRGFLRTLTASG
jgi:ribonuclease D